MRDLGTQILDLARHNLLQGFRLFNGEVKSHQSSPLADIEMTI
jgi:hypothetical protein